MIIITNDSARTNADIIAHSEQLMNEGKLSEALHLLETIEKRNELTSNDHLSCQILRSTLFIKMGQYEEALGITEIAEEESRRLNSPLQIVDTLNLTAEVFLLLGKFDESLEAVDQSEQILKAIPLKQSPEWVTRKATQFNRRGTIYMKKGYFDQALDNYEQSLLLFEKISSKKGIAESLYNIGSIHWRNSELDKSLQYFEQSLRLREELGDNFGVALSLNAVGIIYRRRGDLNKALEYYKRSLVLKEQLGNNPLIAIALNNIGTVYRRKGELEQALEYLQRSLKLKEDTGNAENIALALRNIGLIYRDIGDLDTAIEYHQRCLQLREEVANAFLIIDILFNLILIAIDKRLVEKVRWYLERMVEIKNKNNNKIIHQSYLVSEALVLKMSSRPRDREKAKKLLGFIIKDDILEDEVIKIAMINYYDLVLADLKALGNQQEFDDARILINRLAEVAREQQSYTFLVEVYILQSNLALLELNLLEARKLLTHAQRIADERGLRRLAMTVSKEHDTLLAELSKWEQLIEQGAPLVERAVLLDVQSTVVDIIRRRVAIQSELPKDEPVHIIILKKDEGLTIFSKSFLSVQVDDFSSKIEKTCDLLSSQSLNRFRLDEYTQIIHSEGPFYVCYVFNGQSYSAQQKLTQFVNSVSSNDSLWTALKGSTKPRSTLEKSDRIILENLIDSIFF